MSNYLILEQLGFRMKRLGTTYILDSLELIEDLEVMDILMYKEIYLDISVKRRTSVKAVESNMRESISQTYNNEMFKDIKNLYFKDKVPSNKEMILFLREYIKEYKTKLNNDIME